MLRLIKLPRLALVYHPTLLASTLTSRSFLIISFWYTVFALCLGAAAVWFDIALLSWWPSVVGGSMVGNGKEFVISRVDLASMPTRKPVAVVGKVCEQCLMIFITT